MIRLKKYSKNPRIKKKYIMILGIAVLVLPVGIAATFGRFKTEKVIDVFNAKFKDTFELQFDNQEGSGCDDSEFTVNQELGELCTPTRSGFQFVNWVDENNNVVTSTSELTEPGNTKLYAVWQSVCPYEVNQEWEFNYTGDIEEFSVKCNGTYKLEVYGGQGGNNGGMGGYATGEIELRTDTNLYIGVGGVGGNSSASSNVSIPGGYNGGGNGSGNYLQSSTVTHGGSGGGATHIAINNNLGELYNFVDNKDDILIVAGGGGGRSHYEGWFENDNYNYHDHTKNGGTGGGTAGAIGDGDSGYAGNGGTQTTGCAFGKGCNGSYYSSGGGGGWFGGYGGFHAGGAGGGSGYLGNIINGSMSNGVQTGAGKAKITLLSIKRTSDVTVIYDTAGGSNCSTLEAYTNEPLSYLCKPTRDSYRFVKWIDSNGNTVTNDSVFTSSGIVNLTAVWDNSCLLEPNSTWTFNYTGSADDFVVPCNGTYKVELWGASGFNTTYGGKGAYTVGETNLSVADTLYVMVGSTTTNLNGGFNGGGNGYSNSSGGGGGATDIRCFINSTTHTCDSNLENLSWSDSLGLKSRIMVAAGGGASSLNYVIGHGGGLTGVTAYDPEYASNTAGGGTQTKGGIVVNYSSSFTAGTNGGFGYGGNGGGANNGGSSGGGGGYYGGAGGSRLSSGRWPAGGGSSFISGYAGCDAIDIDGNHTGTSTHYSGKIFNSSQMIPGNEEMPNTTTTGRMVGNKGDGYAKITLLSIDED